MNINIENIEQWMFDFHEGMLSEPDKAKLLNFLHNHPEFNADFGLWAQTHALKNEPVTIPTDLLEGVLKPSAVPFYLNKFFLGTITGISMSAIVIGYLLYKTPTLKTETKIVTKTNYKAINPKENKKELISAKPNQTPISSPANKLLNKQVFKNKKQHLTPLVADTIENLSAKDQKNEELTIIESKSDRIIAIEDLNVLENKVDKVISQKHEIDKPAVTVKKKKNRLPINVKPQSQFKPANPNF